MLELSLPAVRCLGALVEKAFTTPQQYPLSLKALVTACNQRTNREPVTDLAVGDVRAAVDELKIAQLAGIDYAGGRVVKFVHRLDEHFELSKAQTALLGVLLLRGPQTPGELRVRTDRMHPFESVAAVEATLASLTDHHYGAFVEVLPRQPGQSQDRWVHLLGDTGLDVGAPAKPVTAAGSVDVGALESRVGELEEQVAELQEELAQLIQRLE